MSKIIWYWEMRTQSSWKSYFTEWVVEFGKFFPLCKEQAMWNKSIGKSEMFSICTYPDICEYDDKERILA